MRLVLAIFVLAMGCTSGVTPVVLNESPPIAPIVIEHSDDGGFRYFDGCNWITCDGYGACYSTLLGCNVRLRP